MQEPEFDSRDWGSSPQTNRLCDRHTGIQVSIVMLEQTGTEVFRLDGRGPPWNSRGNSPGARRDDSEGITSTSSDRVALERVRFDRQCRPGSMSDMCYWSQATGQRTSRLKPMTCVLQAQQENRGLGVVPLLDDHLLRAC